MSQIFKKKVDELFFSDPERGRQVIDRMRKVNQVRKQSKSKRARSDRIEIIYDPDRSG